MLLSLLNPTPNSGVDLVSQTIQVNVEKETLLASRTMSLENRNPDEWVNSVFKDNILLTLSYLSGEVKNKSEIDWAKVQEPKTVEFSLKPGETFAFHDQVTDVYKSSLVKTTNAHFNYQDGFKSDGYLMGDGVCHIASLIYWAAKDAGLTAVSPTNHDFAEIKDVPKEYGVSIYYLPGSIGTSSRQNLYITNNFDETVTFKFVYYGENLTVEVSSGR